MPESSFFNSIGLPPAGFSPEKPRFSGDPSFRAGYRNIYGTNIGASVAPGTNQGSLDFQFPVGDHQRQNFITGGAYVRPGSSEAPADYGFRLGFAKKIAPQGLSGGELINRALQNQLGLPDQSGPVLNASNRGNFLNSLSPDQIKLLSQDAKMINRDYIDNQLGIRPGAEKYGFDLGVDVKQIPQMGAGMGIGPMVNPGAQEFAQDYAKNLGNSNRKKSEDDYGSIVAP